MVTVAATAASLGMRLNSSRKLLAALVDHFALVLETKHRFTEKLTAELETAFGGGENVAVNSIVTGEVGFSNSLRFIGLVLGCRSTK
jgi:hypothetical protein